jgi:hypothetical protein
LYLFVRSPEAAFWVFRYTRTGKMREMGLGRARGQNAVTLADARVKAGALHRTVRAGQDPLDERDAGAFAGQAEAEQATRRAITFRDVAQDYLADNVAGWSSDKHRKQWANSLATYAYPLLGDLAVAAIGTAEVVAALQPIWRHKPETANRVRGRIEIVLTAATVKGLRTGENPARWHGHLAELLPEATPLSWTVWFWV